VRRPTPRPGETWRVLFADIKEAVTYCPERAVREFDDAASSSVSGY